MPSSHFEQYVLHVSKPGALRAGINYYAAVWRDAEDNAKIRDRPLTQPALVMGGEVSMGPYMEAMWGGVVQGELTVRTIPQAGHWISDENPEFTACAISEFMRD